MFQPTDISGCLIWLQADSVFGMNDGDDFATKFVSSFSNGNPTIWWTNQGIYSEANKFFPLIQVEGNPGLIYHQNRLNTHSTIEMSGSSSIISGSLNSLPLLENMTLIQLYKTISYTSRGGYLFNCTNRFNSISPVVDKFITAFNINGSNKSDWSAISSNAFTANFQFLTVNSGQYLNDWIIRTDILDNNILTFRRNSLILDSGNFSIPNYPAGNFQLGTIGDNVTAFSGEFAEIILYDNALNASGINSIENYLKYKYFVAGGGGFPLNINGCNTGTSGLYNPLVSLFTEAVPSSGSFDLYIAQAYSVSSGTPLYTAGTFVKNDNTTLYTGSSSQSSSSGTLYILGSTPNNSGISLYTQSSTSFNNNVFLYTVDASSYITNTPLYINGVTITNSQNFPFYIQGLQNPSSNNQTALFIAVNASPGTLASGLYNSIPLTTYSATSSPTLPLYLQALSKDSQINNLNLFINQTPTYGTNITTLFVQNNNVMHSGQTKLFIQGQGSLDGGLLNNGNMNLYMERWPTGGITMFMNSSIEQSSVPLYIASANTLTSGIPIIVTGRNQLLGSGSANLFLQSTYNTFASHSLFVSGIPNFNTNTVLYTNGF